MPALYPRMVRTTLYDIKLENIFMYMLSRKLVVAAKSSLLFKVQLKVNVKVKLCFATPSARIAETEQN